MQSLERVVPTQRLITHTTVNRWGQRSSPILVAEPYIEAQQTCSPDLESKLLLDIWEDRLEPQFPFFSRWHCSSAAWDHSSCACRPRPVAVDAIAHRLL